MYPAHIRPSKLTYMGQRVEGNTLQFRPTPEIALSRKYETAAVLNWGVDNTKSRKNKTTFHGLKVRAWITCSDAEAHSMIANWEYRKKISPYVQPKDLTTREIHCALENVEFSKRKRVRPHKWVLRIMPSPDLSRKTVNTDSYRKLRAARNQTITKSA